MTFTIRIPGTPYAQKRARATNRGPHARVYDPQENRDWAGMARTMFAEALKLQGRTPPAFDGAVELRVLAVFLCPKSDHRKTAPVPRRHYVSHGRNDWDNIGKAVSDAGNGVLWLDDGQVWRGSVERWIGAQGEAPFVEVEVIAAPEPRTASDYSGANSPGLFQ